MFIYLFSTIDLLYRRSENNYSAFHHHPFVFTLISTKANVLLLDGILFISYCRWKQCTGSGMQRQSSGLSAPHALRSVSVCACVFCSSRFFLCLHFLFLFLLLRQIDTSTLIHYYVRTQWLHTIMFYKQFRTKYQRKRLRCHYNICWIRLCTCWLYEINWKETEPRQNKAHFPLNLS